MNFPAYALLTNETAFIRDGGLNHHNQHLSVQENPHVVRYHAAQHSFKVNVCAGLVDDCLVGPYILACRLAAVNYLIFLGQDPPDLLVPRNVRHNMQF